MTGALRRERARFAVQWICGVEHENEGEGVGILAGIDDPVLRSTLGLDKV